MNTIKITEDSLKIALNNVSGIEPAKSGSFTGLTPSTLVPFENSMYIDKRCHLEVMDTNHRYSKNLRAYYSLYKKINEKVSDIHTTSKCSGVGNFQENAEPTKPTIYQGKMWTGDDHVSLLGIDTDKTHSYALFFTWLNSPAVVEVPECSLEELNRDVVVYCDEAQRSLYTIVITEDGRFMSCAVDHSGDGSDSTAGVHASCCRSALGTECKLEYLSTGPMGWIFCIHEYVLYAGLKKTTSPRLHHSSFVAGGPVQAAGMFVIEDGRLTKLFAHSGHYRPSEKSIYQLLNYLISRNVDLTDVLMDAQRIVRISREKESGAKEKKMNTTVMWPAVTILHFLKHKCLYERLAMNAVLSRAAADISRNESRWLNRSDLASRGKDVTALVVTPIFPFEEDTPTDEDISRTPERMRMASAVSTDSLVGDFPSLGTFSKRTALDFTPFVQNK